MMKSYFEIHTLVVCLRVFNYLVALRKLEVILRNDGCLVQVNVIMHAVIYCRLGRALTGCVRAPGELVDNMVDAYW